MINEMLYLLFSVITCIVFMVRFGFLRRLLPKSLAEKILVKLDSLKVSTPNLKSTSDSNNSTSL
jgi:hypothetical protein